MSRKQPGTGTLGRCLRHEDQPTAWVLWGWRPGKVNRVGLLSVFPGVRRSNEVTPGQICSLDSLGA